MKYEIFGVDLPLYFDENAGSELQLLENSDPVSYSFQIPHF